MSKKMTDDEFKKMKAMFTKKLIKSEKDRLNSIYNGNKIENMSTEGLENEYEYVPNITEQMKREQDEREVRDYYNSIMPLSTNNKEMEKMYEDRVKGGKKPKNKRSKRNRKSKKRKGKTVRKYK